MDIKKVNIIVGVILLIIAIPLITSGALSKSKIDDKISPLYKIRSSQAIEGRVETPRSSYLGERIFIWSLLKIFMQENKISSHGWTDINVCRISRVNTYCWITCICKPLPRLEGLDT